MLVVHPAFYFFSYILPWDPQGQFRSNKLVKSALSCRLIRNFSSMYPRVFRDPEQSHRIPGENVIQHLLALLYQWWRHFGSPKGYQSCQAIKANTNIFLWPSIHLNFVNTDQVIIHLRLENCSVSIPGELYNHKFPNYEVFFHFLINHTLFNGKTDFHKFVRSEVLLAARKNQFSWDMMLHHRLLLGP